MGCSPMLRYHDQVKARLFHSPNLHRVVLCGNSQCPWTWTEEQSGSRGVLHACDPPRFRHLCSKIPKIHNWSMNSGVHSVCFRGDFAIKTVVGFLRYNSFENVAHVQAFYSDICNTFCCRLILLSSLPWHSQGFLRWFYFCLFFIVSQWVLQTVYWKVLGYFTMIFHICVTRFHDSMGYDMIITIRFT